MKSDVDGNIKDERSKKLASLDAKLEKKFRIKYLNKELTVLFEKKINHEKELYEGYADNYIRVLAKSTSPIEGKIIKTKIMEDKDGELFGILIT